MSEHDTAGQTNTGALWGGRFASGPAPALAALSRSTQFDWVLADVDLTGSLAHAAALHRAGLLSDDDHAVIAEALQYLRSEAAAGTLTPEESDEDVHGALERILIERIGPEVGDGSARAGVEMTRSPPWSGCTCAITPGPSPVASLMWSMHWWTKQ